MRPVSAMDAGSIAERLAVAGCVSPREEARELRDSAPDEAALEEMVRRREDGEPLAWITGTASFGRRRMRVDPGVYVPRPQSEELAVRASGLLPERGRALDLCTGSGAIALLMSDAKPSAIVVGADVDPRCVACARSNGVRAVRCDLGSTFRASAFDVVTAVAPYVPTPELRLLPSDVTRFEPSLALDGGADGLDVVRRVVVSAARLLRPGGWMLVEIGGAQDERLRPALEDSGFPTAETWTDDAGDLRGLAARLG